MTEIVYTRGWSLIRNLYRPKAFDPLDFDIPAVRIYRSGWHFIPDEAAEPGQLNGRA